MLDITTLRLSYSSYNGSYQSCERKFEFSKLYPHTEDQEISLDGETGHALHVGYQSWLMERDRDKALEAMMFRYPIGLCSNPVKPKSLEACFASLNQMTDSGIFLEYEIATIKCPDGVIRKAVEVPFQININNFSLSDSKLIKVIYVGIIDVILYNTLTDEYIVTDIKTTRWDLPDYSVLYNFDAQCLPYAMILERILGHKLDHLKADYLVCYVDIMKPRALRYSFDKTAEDIRDWARTLLVDLTNMKTFYNMGWFPRRPKSCIAFNKPCRFYDICHSRDPETITEWFLMGKEPIKEREFKPWFTMDLELVA